MTPSAPPPATRSLDLEQRLSHLWQRGQRPDVHRVLAEAGHVAPDRLAAVLGVDQRERWLRGERPPAEMYLQRYPALQAEAELALELVYGEYLLREQRGETPELADYVRRFPQYAARLQEQGELHRALAAESTRLLDTQPPAPEATNDGSVAGPDLPVVPGYEVLEELGRGGMGIVYRARQVQLKRLVALKMLRAGADADSEELSRFRAEAEAVARLQHPNIVQIHEVGEHAGRAFFAMELVPGGSLERKLAGTPQPARQAAELLATLALAIDHAHKQGIVHRDLKPENVLLTADGTPKISDFGLAKLMTGAVAQTQTGAILGTPCYMAPEQASGQSAQIGPATDVYALGAILYQVLTGRPPFLAATLLETLRQVREDEPVPPRRLQPKLPRDLETICLKCLHKEQARRYPSAGALADDLSRFLADEPIRARPVGLPERSWRWCRRRPAQAVLIGLLLLAIGLGGGGITWKWLEAATNFHDASTNLAKAEAETLRFRKKSYVSDMKLAWQAWDEGRIGRVQQLLESHRPPPEQEDVRQFEWYCLEQASHAERLTLRGHEGPVKGLAYSLDGSLLATGGDDDTIRLWDAATGREVGILRGHRGRISSLAFSPDGKTLASSGGGWENGGLPVTGPGQVKLWDVAQQKELPFLTETFGSVGGLAFSPNGRVLAVQASESHARLLDIRMGKDVVVLPSGYRDSLLALALSPDGKTLAGGYSDGIVRLWDTTIGDEKPALRGHTNMVTALAFAPSGLELASGAQHGELRFWDLATGKARPFGLGPKDVRHLAYSSDGKTLFAASSGADRSAEIKVLDAASGRLLDTLRGHTDTIRRLASSPDGRTLASASADGTVRLWDTPPSVAPEIHGGPVSALAFSPDSQTLATGSWDHTIKLWNLATGRLRATLHGHGDKVGALAFSPDGKALASAGLDQAVRIWDVAAAREQAVFAGQQVQPYRLAFSPDGKALAWGAFGAVKLHDLRTGRERLIPLDGGPVVGALAFRRDGTLAVAGNDGTLRLFDGATGRHLADLPGHINHVPCVVFSPDGKALASAGTDGTVRLWDVDSRKELATFRSHAGIVNFVAFTGDGQFLVSGGTDNAVRVWDLATRQLRQTWPQKRVSINCGAAAPDGRTLAWGDADGRVTLWNGTAGQWLLELGTHMARAAAYSPNGKSLALATYGQVLLLDAVTGREQAALPVAAPWAWAAAFSPDGTILATGEGDYPQSEPGVVRLWDAATRELLAVLKGHRHAVYALAFAPDGKTLVSGGGDGDIRLWDVATQKERAAFTLGESGRMVRAIAFAPDGKTFAAASSSQWSNVPCQVKLWDPATGQERATLQGFTGVEALAFSPDSRILASAGYDQTVRLWDVAAGTEKRVLEGHTQTVTSLAFSPDGRRLASGSIYGSVNLWDLDTGEEVATLPNHDGPVHGVAFSPDGETLATATAGWAPAQAVRFWRAPRGR